MSKSMTPGCLMLMLGATTPWVANAEMLWKADFEAGNFDNWSYLLNKQGLSISTNHSSEGKFAAKITVQGKPDYLWHAKPYLNRVELQHKPKTVAPDKDTYIAWDVMFPKLLSNKRHEFAYWETDRRYQQIMRFDIAANRISFKFSDQKDVLWEFSELKPLTWYSMAMQIHWSDDAQKGSVSIWFDDEKVLDNANMITLPDISEKAFIQLGILRDLHPQSETLWLDNVREADNIEALLAL